MNLLSIFRRHMAASNRDALDKAVQAHERAAQAVAAHKARGDTRGQHEATARAHRALHERMRLELDHG